MKIHIIEARERKGFLQRSFQRTGAQHYDLDDLQWDNQSDSMV